MVEIDMSINSKDFMEIYHTLSKEQREALWDVQDSGTWNSGLWVRWRAVEYLIAEIIKLEREKGETQNGKI